MTEEKSATAKKKLSIQEKLDTALQFKEAGNGLYKQGDVKRAAKNYHRAVLYLKVSCCKGWSFQDKYSLLFNAFGRIR